VPLPNLSQEYRKETLDPEEKEKLVSHKAPLFVAENLVKEARLSVRVHYYEISETGGHQTQAAYGLLPEAYGRDGGLNERARF